MAKICRVAFSRLSSSRCDSQIASAMADTIRVE